MTRICEVQKQGYSTPPNPPYVTVVHQQCFKDHIDRHGLKCTYWGELKTVTLSKEQCLLNTIQIATCCKENRSAYHYKSTWLIWNMNSFSYLCGTWAQLYNLKSSLPSDHRKISNRFLVQCKENTGLWPPLRQASSYCCSLMLHWGLPKTHHFGAQWFRTHRGVACKECWFHLPINHVIVEERRGTKTWRAEK